jgi:ubiquinone/menaquinone biosynthesis C-methylase UbiE
VNPWLQIPALDYEGHMTAVGQLAALGAVFRDVYLQTRPRRLAILGCATGNGIEHVDASITSEVIGVDINAEYLGRARERFAGGRFTLTLMNADAARVEVAPASLDLVHLALVLEYVDPAAVIARAAPWLSPGGVCCVVLQRPSKTEPPVTPTRFASLGALAGLLRLHEPEAIEELAERARLFRTRSWDVALPNDKRLYVGLFCKKRPWR